MQRGPCKNYSKLQTHDPVIYVFLFNFFTQLDPKLLFFKQTRHMPKHNRQGDTKNSIGLQQVPLSRLTQSRNTSNLNFGGAWFKS